LPAQDTEELTDPVALARTAAGDDSAFERIVERYEAAVLRYVRGLTGDPDRAEDAMQETFISAWRHAGDFRGAASARSWLLSIARNALSRTARRHAGEPANHLPLEALATEAGWGDTTADRLTERLDARERVEAGFRGLSADDREILILRDLEGFTGEEIADMLGIGLAAQKSRLHRARLRFMANLKGGDGHGP